MVVRVGDELEPRQLQLVQPMSAENSKSAGRQAATASLRGAPVANVSVVEQLVDSESDRSDDAPDFGDGVLLLTDSGDFARHECTRILFGVRPWDDRNP